MKTNLANLDGKTLEWYRVAQGGDPQPGDRITDATGDSFTLTEAELDKLILLHILRDGVELGWVVTDAAAQYGTVRFYSMGGSEVADVTGLRFGEPVPKPADPVRNGYTFGGWYQDEACTEPWDFENDTVTSVLQELYAKWKLSVSAFTDLDPAGWYYEGVCYCVENALMNGVGNGRFDPNGTTTRAMLVTILYRMENEPEVTGSNPFDDVADGRWYTDAVIWAAETGITTGTGVATFSPNDELTREQLATFLRRYAEYRGLDVNASADLHGYTDADSISNFAQASMKWAVAVGIISGTSETTLSPRKSATRAEIATMLMRYCMKIAE